MAGRILDNRIGVSCMERRIQEASKELNQMVARQNTQWIDAPHIWYLNKCDMILNTTYFPLQKIYFQTLMAGINIIIMHENQSFQWKDLVPEKFISLIEWSLLQQSNWISSNISSSLLRKMLNKLNKTLGSSMAVKVSEIRVLKSRDCEAVIVLQSSWVDFGLKSLCFYPTGSPAVEIIYNDLTILPNTTSMPDGIMPVLLRMKNSSSLNSTVIAITPATERDSTALQHAITMVAMAAQQNPRKREFEEEDSDFLQKRQKLEEEVWNDVVEFFDSTCADDIQDCKLKCDDFMFDKMADTVSNLELSLTDSIATLAMNQYSKKSEEQECQYQVKLAQQDLETVTANCEDSTLSEERSQLSRLCDTVADQYKDQLSQELFSINEQERQMKDRCWYYHLTTATGALMIVMGIWSSIQT